MDHKNTESNSSFSGVKVHPNAFVDPRAELHDGVIISQGAIVGPDVSIGKGTEIGPNAVISGRTQIGVNNKVCLLYTSPSPRDRTRSRMPSSA